MIKSRFIFAILLAFACNPAWATKIYLPATQDNTLYESGSGLLSNGSGEHMFAGVPAEPVRRRAVIAFKNIHLEIPEDATITSARLHLHMSRENSEATIIEVYRLTSDWGEGSSNALEQEGTGANSTPGDATWIHTRWPNFEWSAPGGDFAAEPSSLELVDSVGFYTFGPSPDMATDVQLWLDNPAQNFGWILVAGELRRSAKRFDTKENEVEAFRPVLEITYSRTGTSFDYSGPWYDPSLNGEGYLAFQTPDGWLFYYFGYSSEGTFLWLVSEVFVLEDLVYGVPFELDMWVGVPGTFTEPSTELQRYGTLSVRFDSCETGQFILTGLEPDKTSNVIKLAGVDGTTCVDLLQLE
ncbi:DNRLRE domain-containing protein [Pseudomonadota bacterium]